MDKETEFLAGLIGLQYGEVPTPELVSTAQLVSWAKGWPENKTAFWNAEAFMWRHKINAGVREIIADELTVLCQGRNLDLGCGSYSYIPSVGFDLSPKMLEFNKNCADKVQGDLELVLPFKNREFDSVTAVLALNYVKNKVQLLSEVWRVLNGSGAFVMVLSGKGVNAWQGQKEVSCYSAAEWGNILHQVDFSVEFYEKQELWFFRCGKGKGY